MIATYEAGYMGLELARFLVEMPVHGVVAAPGKLPLQAADRITTDRCGAQNSPDCFAVAS